MATKRWQRQVYHRPSAVRRCCLNPYASVMTVPHRQSRLA